MSETEALAGALVALARSIDRHAAAIENMREPFFPPNNAAPGGVAPPGPPAGVSSPSAGAKSPAEVWMPKAVFKVCKEQGWDIADIGQRATGRRMDPDSREWPVDDLKAVLAAFKEWGV